MLKPELAFKLNIYAVGPYLGEHVKFHLRIYLSAFAQKMILDTRKHFKPHMKYIQDQLQAVSNKFDPVNKEATANRIVPRSISHPAVQRTTPYHILGDEL